MNEPSSGVCRKQDILEATCSGDAEELIDKQRAHIEILEGFLRDIDSIMDEPDLYAEAILEKIGVPLLEWHVWSETK